MATPVQIHKRMLPGSTASIESAGLQAVVDGNAIQISKTFTWQSYFDSTLLQNAVLSQPANTTIVSPVENQFPGYAIGLHPSSQTAISVIVKGFGTTGNSSIYTLVPGQIITPFGGNKFRSFRWGLPFGWLGGGMANLLVLQNPYEPEMFSARPEIPYHRARFQVLQPATLLATGGTNNAPLNWPGRFPWINAAISISGQVVPQAGNPSVSPEPTRILMTLRGVASLATPTPMRAIIQASDEFGLDAGGVAGATTLTNSPFQEIVWPAWNSIGTNGNLAAQNPVLEFDTTSPLVRLAADSAGVVFVDDSGAGVLANAFVDVVRYGRF